MGCATDDPAGPGTKLTNAEVEPAGAHCAAGGVAVHVAFDDNHNGLIDAGEQYSTTYVCSHPTLLREDPIGSGAICPGGGVLVRSGHDVDDNGSLADSEIEDTATVCHSDEIYRGELKTSDFTTDASRERLSHVRVVTGNVLFDGAAPMPSLELVGGNIELRTPAIVELPKLDRIVGNLSGPPPSLSGVRRGGNFQAPVLGSIGGYVSLSAGGEGTTFSAPSLTAVDGKLLLAGKYTTVALDKLATVGGDLDIDVMTQAPKLSLPAVKSVAGNVIVSGWFTDLDMSSLETATGFDLVYSSLASLTLPALKSSTLVRIGQSASLETVEMPNVASVKTVSIYGSPKLAVFDLPLVTELDKLAVQGLTAKDLGMFASLRAVKALTIQSNHELLDLGGLDQLSTVASLTINSNAKLADLGGLDALASVTGNLTIQRNPALTSLRHLAALTNVGGQITIADNTALPASDVDAFLHRLGR